MLWRTRVTNATGAPLLDLRYAYDPVGNVTRITDVPRQANNWPTSGFTFQDAFNSKDTANWTWSSYQAVPFNDGGNNVVKNTGTGSSYDANFYRSAYSLASGQGLQLRFKVDQAETIAHFSIEANDATYRRFGVIANGGKLYVQYRDDGATWRYPADVLTNLQVNTWYVLRIVVDDGGRGFYVEAYQEANPAIRGSYNVIMPTGKQWRFRHWIYRGTAYIDDYREFSTTGLTWTPDERMGFTYDALDRLVGAGPVNGGTGYTAAYAYNPIGNITSKAENGAGWAYTYGDAAHKHAVTSLSNGWSYQYDANGNMISRTENGVTYQQTFDAENRLVRVTGNGQTAQFFYDGDGNRVKVTSGVTTTVYVGMLEVTINGTQRITRTYYSLGAQMVAMRVVSSTGNTVYYLHSDHLGSVSLVTDHASRVVAQQRFLPYGGVRWQEGTFPTDVGFTGHRGHPDLGLVYMRARYYHVALGRFVSADTVVPEPGNPQDLNRYTYTGNNPLRFVDPDGHARKRPGRNPGEKEMSPLPRPKPLPPPPPVSPLRATINKITSTLNRTVLAPRADASVHTWGVNAGVLKFYAFVSFDIVSTKEGDIRAFVTVPDSELLGSILGMEDIGKVKRHLMGMSDDTFPLYTPQAAMGGMRGWIWGEEFSPERKGAMAYAGPFINIGGGYQVAAANIFLGVDPRTGMPPRDPQTGRLEILGGVELGGGLTPQHSPVAGGYVNVTYSIPIGPLHVKLDESWQVAACRLVGMCGR